jgi:hypothetical protein
LAVKTVHLRHLKTYFKKMLNGCADSGETVFVDISGERFLAIQLPNTYDDDIGSRLFARWR